MIFHGVFQSSSRFSRLFHGDSPIENVIKRPFQSFQAFEMQLFPLLLGVTGLSPLFGAFAAVNVAGALAVYHLVPETSGRSLEEVELQLWQDRKIQRSHGKKGEKVMENANFGEVKGGKF